MGSELDASLMDRSQRFILETGNTSTTSGRLFAAFAERTQSTSCRRLLSGFRPTSQLPCAQTGDVAAHGCSFTFFWTREMNPDVVAIATFVKRAESIVVLAVWADRVQHVAVFGSLVR
jgi:hypothetical protein